MDELLELKRTYARRFMVTLSALDNAIGWLREHRLTGEAEKLSEYKKERLGVIYAEYQSKAGFLVATGAVRLITGEETHLFKQVPRAQQEDATQSANEA